MKLYQKIILILIVPIVVVFAKTNQSKAIQDLIENRSNSTYVANEEILIQKLNSIVSAGVENLQIITDFDNTLTIDDGIEGKRVLNTFEMFRLCPSVPQTYKEEEYKLYEKYKPIENDPKINETIKSEYMLEWYRAAHNLMKGIKFPRSELSKLARNMSKCCIRYGVDELFSWSKLKKVPIVILSSGLGDALTAILDAANLVSPNIEVISNYLDLNDEDIIEGMRGDPIHSYNKNEATIQDSEFYNNNRMKNRKNVILMGDVIGDAKIADGLEQPNNIVKIAFLSKKRSNNLQTYLENFDIVLYSDQTLNFLIKVLKLISC